ASKMRFMTAQFEAYLHNDLWLSLAKGANQQAAQLEAIIEASPKLRLAWQREINEVFAVIKNADLTKLKDAGVYCALWQAPAAERDLVGPNEALIRMVTSWATTDDDLKNLKMLLQKL
ncbi:MAG: low specificity L-threonine aldolase, partial [Pseudomonadota bacterium]